MAVAQANDIATDNFYKWEIRGRGWHSFENPVQLEPIYVPFFPANIYNDEIKDDAISPNIIGRIGSFVGNLTRAETNKNEVSYEEALEEHYAYRAYIIDKPESLGVLVINLPTQSKTPPESILELLTMISDTKESISFEIVGTTSNQKVQIVCSHIDALKIKLQIRAYYPDAFIDENEIICSNNKQDENCIQEVVEFGLKNEFTIPIKRYNKTSGETYQSFFSLLENINQGEEITLQVIFKGAVNPWSKSIIDAITSDDGNCFFIDAPELLPLAREKTANPLFAAVIRILIKSNSESRLTVLKNELISIICNQSNSFSNQIIPIDGENNLVLDFTNRVSHRLGMLLNIEELANFVHFPDTNKVIGNLFKNASKTRPSPLALSNHEYKLGENIHLNNSRFVSLDISHRLRHIHIIGSTGTGKSTLLTNLICQDIELGNGIALIDPHGDLVEFILKVIPENRIKDVVLVDPSDSEFPVGLNILQAETETERIVLSSDLVSAIKKQSTSWGDQMTTILSNAINAILESSLGGTLFDLRRFLVDDSFRNKFLKTVDDPTIIHFWQKEYQMLRKNAISPILVRLDTFLRPKTIRNMMAQKNGLNFNSLIAENKIVLIKLPQGLIGEENSHLLGSLIVSKIQQAAQARQAITQIERMPYFLYLDEFQNFITPSMSAILSGSRKYGLGLILAHQDMEQVSKYDGELANSILSNPATRICFKMGDVDARKLENGFANFDSKDLQNLHVGEAIVKVDTTDQDFNLKTYFFQQKDLIDFSQECIANSRNIYSKPKSEVENYIYSLYDLKTIPNEKAKEDIDVPNYIEKHDNSYHKLLDSTQFEIKKNEYLNKVELIEKTTEHRYLQNFIKKVAESKGYKAVIEEPINNGESRVDVGLSYNDIKIAIEISVTNTSNYEAGNILKCLNAGYSTVIMCSNNPKKIEGIKETIMRTIEPKMIPKVLFYTPSQLFTYLDNIIDFIKPQQEKRIKGYRVKVTYQ